jgi:hypothetical protein
MFELNKKHKSNTKVSWKRQGMKFTEEEFEYIYNEYIKATHCDLCDKEFKNRKDRQLDHCHETGDIRNIVCNRCNCKKADNKIRSDNKSGYRNIYKEKNSRCKQGFYWKFQVHIDCKLKVIKSSVDLDKLIIFRDKWLKENDYNT